MAGLARNLGCRALRLAATLALVLPAGRARAIGGASNDDGDVSIEATGSVRLTGAFLHYRAMPEPFPQQDDGLLGSVTRLIVEGQLGPMWSYQSNLFLDVSRMPTGTLGGALATAASFEGATPYRTRYLSGSFWDDGGMAATMGIDRFSFDALAEPLKITVGRFPINYSVTNLFTPNDFFAPFSPTAINTEYKPGVDALRFNVALGSLSSLEVVEVMGNRIGGSPAWSRSGLLARASTVVWDFEWALLGGKLAERWVAGLSWQGGLGPVNLRGEGHVGFADQDGDGVLDGDETRPTGRDPTHVRLAAGLDVPFEWQNATIAAEYGFSSDGAARPEGYLRRAALAFPDDPTLLGQHYVGASAGAEIIPILRVGVSGILNPSDQSGLAVATLNYSVADEAQFVTGLLVPWGRRPVAAPAPESFALESELGAMPLAAFVETRFAF